MSLVKQDVKMSNPYLNFPQLPVPVKITALNMPRFMSCQRKPQCEAWLGYPRQRGSPSLAMFRPRMWRRQPLKPSNGCEPEKHELAQHPNCGTNYVISGIFAGFGAWWALWRGERVRQKARRLPIMILLATIALILTRRVGPMVQKEITTSGDPGEMELVRVETSLQTNLKIHYIVTKG